METPRTNSEKGTKVESLTDKLGAFYGFVEKRVHDPQLARDLVHDALLKAIEHEGLLKEQTVVPWFYRVLRNSIVDMYRTQQAKNKALERISAGFLEECGAKIQSDLCKCMNGLWDELKPAYADVLRNVDLGGKRLTEYARERGRSENAMRVKLHRAREQMKAALKGNCKGCAEHDCLSCDC